MTDDFGSNATPDDDPSAWSELRRRGREAPTAEPPADLRALLEVQQASSKEVRFVERATSPTSDGSSDDLSGYRPPWV